MLWNLDTALRREGIRRKDLATLLGVTEKTVANKIKGKSEFSYSEFCAIKKLLPSYSLDQLFKNEAQTPELPSGG